MIRKIVEMIKQTPQDEINQRLDAYEREAIKQPSRWAKDAPLPEIMVILTKLSYPVTLQFMDDRDPFKAYELHKASKEYYRTGKVDKLMEAAQKHNYFCTTGIQFMKEQELYSVLVGGTLFKVSPDSKYFLKSATNEDVRNQKAVDDFILNLLEKSEIGELNFTDWKIIFLIRRYDDAPVNTLTIHGRLIYTVQPNVIQRHLTKLTKHGYLKKFGVKKTSSYILTSKAWQAIAQAKKEYFKDVRFWDNGLNLQILNENGSDSTKQSNS